MANHTTTQEIQKAAREANRGESFKAYWLTDDEAMVLESSGHVPTRTIFGDRDVATYRLARDPVYYHRWVERD